MEITTLGPIEFIQTIHNIFGRMTVYNIKQDKNSIAMSHIYQLFQLVRCTIATKMKQETSSKFIPRYTPVIFLSLEFKEIGIQLWCTNLFCPAKMTMELLYQKTYRKRILWKVLEFFYLINWSVIVLK